MLKMHITARPSTAGSRAFTINDAVHPPIDPLRRNSIIVGECDLLIAAPDGPERLRSGTWSTIRAMRRRMAWRAGEMCIVMPDGHVERIA